MTNWITRGDVEHGVLNHLQLWLPYGIARVEREQGIGVREIATPKAWDIVTQFSRFPEDRLPWIAVVSAGIHGGKAPYRDGDGEMIATWLVACGAVVAAKDADSAKELAGYYGAAIRGVMTQKPSMEGLAQATEWNDETYIDIGRSQEKNLASVRLVFSLEIHGVLNVFDGYVGPTPPENPYEDPPLRTRITDVEIVVTPEPMPHE